MVVNVFRSFVVVFVLSSFNFVLIAKTSFQPTCRQPSERRGWEGGEVGRVGRVGRVERLGRLGGWRGWEGGEVGRVERLGGWGGWRGWPTETVDNDFF